VYLRVDVLLLLGEVFWAKVEETFMSAYGDHRHVVGHLKTRVEEVR
jgi:hypothetical protein